MKKAGVALCVIFCGILLMFVPAGHYQSVIAENVLRLHVVANSDSPRDQALKLDVRDSILDFLSGPLKDCATRQESEAVIRELLPGIEATARQLLRSRGCDYTVKASLGEDYFPEKAYGEMTFPRGYYESLTIHIGKSRGRNWWCVLFPSLCFTDAVTARVPESSRKLLSQQLGEDVCDALYEGEQTQLRFWILDRLGQWF